MYGKIIKKIRKEKGFTQKEIYTGVVSKTFYSDFEAEKYSVELVKFQELLTNLGISYEEFEYYRKENQVDEAAVLEKQIDELYKTGKFEALYDLYEKYYRHENTALRYLAIQAYLLVLITNTNFYKFSRAPFSEILAELENAKMWTLKELKLSKLVLLSLSEQDKERAESLYQRIVAELKKYQAFDSKIYYEEIGDLHFNRIQSLLVINDIESAEATLSRYRELLQGADQVYLSLQLLFIDYLVRLYLDFTAYQEKMQDFLAQMKAIQTSETHFYQIIYQIHQEKAKNYWQRYR
ncbi:transcriptional regulator with XRE-family HTH domain [Enterococcus sp. PF1-24]|uniref:helix-turn-helix domain-containing protein n=1 Tax=unclassified Enterococcus TaxID=2608891 RepID=UPI0024763EE8|nr:MULTISPECIES: helix-turn-helix domain-containing protein [unclassified Enterococcus]MDH6363740.1 transcriptional regulator with XRE-family HTH domain [Enterococcus sp. PFB1-1]MDH6400696.1 transcriptional regulator with XRE-family HTH domain [Enterococcus sp. PF1-24]